MKTSSTRRATLSRATLRCLPMAVFSLTIFLTVLLFALLYGKRHAVRASFNRHDTGLHVPLAAAPQTSPPTSTHQTAYGGRNIRVFVGVLSRSYRHDMRQAIRQTWGGHNQLERVMFFVMRPHNSSDFKALRAEARQFGDVVVTSEIMESYHNGTYSVISIFRVAAALADRITHVLKTDEDCYVRVPLLVQMLQQLPGQWLYAGHFTTTSVSRDPKYK